MNQIGDDGLRDRLPLSLLNDYLFCNRRAALKILEGLWGENVHTLVGDLAHEHADLPGYEIAKGVTLLRALPVWSERLGLNGKCDIVEVESGSTSNLKSKITDWKTHGVAALRPVEYKKGKRRHFDNDDVQLCAQALCLEEMFKRPVERGAIFHAASKRRREVEFTPELRHLTETAIADLHALVETGAVPPAVLKPQCEQCSLFEICLPAITSLPARVQRAADELLRV